MGYTTEFRGQFKVDRPVDDETYNLLVGLASTRRMKRNIEGFGVEGEFFIDNDGNYGQNRTPDVVDYNSPPSTQPSLWCQWMIGEDKQTIEWDGGEKFYAYVKWIEYFIESILKPKGYILNGSVQYRGEDWDDNGTITVINNNVSVE